MTLLLSALGIIVGLIACAELVSNLVSIALSLDTAKTILETNMIENLYEAILPVGLSLLVLYFLMDIMEKTTHDNFTPEHLVKGMLKLCLGALLMTNLMDIMLGFLDLSKLIGEEIDLTFNYDPILQIPTLDAKGLIALVGELLSFVINAIPSLIVVIAVYLTSISRNLNIAILAIFAPIGVSNIFMRGMDSPGMNYVKKFFALCLQGAVIAGIAAVYLSLVVDMSSYVPGQSSISTGSFNMFTELLVGFAVTPLIFKSRNIANEIVGVR